MKFSLACLTAVLVPVAILANEDQPQLVASSIAISDTNMNIPKEDIRSSSFSKVKDTSVYKKLSETSNLRSEPTKLQNNKPGVDVDVNVVADVNHAKINTEEAVGSLPGAVFAAVATTADSGEEECVPPVTVTNTVKLDTGNLPLSSCSSKKQICLYSINRKKSSTSSSIKKMTGYCVDDTDVPSSYWAIVDRNYTDVLDTYHEDHTFTSIATIPSNKMENGNMNVQDQVQYSYVTDDHRHLQYNDCSMCNYRPQITVSGNALQALIIACINDFDDCPETFNYPTTPIGCWDVSKVKNMDSAFYNQDNFNSPLGCWNTESVTSMDSMFYYAFDFNQNINTWNTGSVTSMVGMFSGAYSFNQPLDSWNVNSVMSMQYMFVRTYFNQNINTWNTGSVTSMYGMFIYATSFNQPLDSWNVNSVTSMSGMFVRTTNFNQNINTWNTGSVTSMSGLFSYATSFNQPLDNWNVNSVTSMSGMFSGINFNQNINTWNTGSVTSMSGLFYNARSFNQPLDDWNVTSVTYMDFMFMLTENFNQCLSTWAGKTTALALTDEMFDDSSCPYTTPLNTEFDVGPWCQGPAQGCNVPSPSPSVEPSEESSKTCSSIGGGCNNYASGTGSTVSGGEANKASGEYSSIGGGFENVAKGTSSVVIGGSSNQAIGAYSIAMGKSAIAKGDSSLVINLGKKAATSKKVGEFLVNSKAFSVSSKLFSIRIGKEKVTINKNNINNFKDLLNDDSRRLKQIDGQQAIIEDQQAQIEELHANNEEHQKQIEELHSMMTNFIAQQQQDMN